jgi:putative MATE family efflux protein
MEQFAMQGSGAIRCQSSELLLSDRCSRKPVKRDVSVGKSTKFVAQDIESCPHQELRRQLTAEAADIDVRTRTLLEKPIASLIMRLAIPNATVMAVQVLIGLLEVFFVSRLGVDALAGVVQVFPLVSMVVAISQGATGGGIVTTVARTLGNGRIEAASEYAWYAVALSIPLGVATTALMLVFGPTLYGYMGTSGDALTIALSYSSVIFAGATLIWTFNLLMAVVRGTGNLRVPVIVVCSGAVILVPLSPTLIFGAFGFHGMGPAGGAVAMLVYYGLGTLAYAAYLWGKFGVLKPSVRVPKFSFRPALAILRIGGMSAVVAGSTNLTLAIVTAFVGMGGVEASAGYGAGSRLEFLLVPLSYGIGGPVGIVVSANLGAGRTERAVRASWIGVVMACTLTELIGLTAATFPQLWIGIFSQDPYVLQVGAEYLHRVGPFFGFFGLGYVLYCAGQATRRMKATVVAALLRATIAVFGGYLVALVNADITWNFVAVALGMVAFGLFALPALIARTGYE